MTIRQDILAFLRQPEEFAASAADPQVWLAGLEAFALPWIAANGDRTLRPAQEAAWRGLAERRAGLVLGPPGTGKTHLLSWLIAAHGPARAAAGLPSRTFVTAFTRNAAGNLLDAVAARQARHDSAAPRPIYFGPPPAARLGPRVDLLGRGDEAALLRALETGRAVVGATIWSLYRLLASGMAVGADGPTAPLFDLVCIDEASQTISLTPDLNRALTDYAAAYEQTYGQAEPVAELIPAMLEAFLESDRNFARRRRQAGR